MLRDHRALKIYVDGSAIKNPGGPGGCAAIAEFPEDWNRPNEPLFQVGYKATTNNRMELTACILALRYLRDQGSRLDVQRVLIITDSRYVHDFHRFASRWRGAGWKTAEGRPVENSDLWKDFLSAQSKAGVRTDLCLSKGKSRPVLKEVDRAAKHAAHNATETDWGFRPGKVGRSRVEIMRASTLFPTSGQETIIHIYRKTSVGRADHKVYFHTWSEETRNLAGKFHAYASAAIDADLHRGHAYRVRFNADPRYPIIEYVVGEFDPDAPPDTDGDSLGE